MKKSFGIEYTCYTSLSPDDEKYITEIEGSIVAYQENITHYEEVGKFGITYVNLDLSKKDGYFTPVLFDWEEIAAFGEHMIDFENNSFKNIDQGNSIEGGNLLVLHYIEIAAKYRGRFLAALVLKDVINRFGHNCAFVATQIYASQHGYHKELIESEQDWLEVLKLDELEKDEEQAFYKIAAYFQSLGFINIVDDIFAFNVSKVNFLDNFSLQINNNSDER